MSQRKKIVELPSYNQDRVSRLEPPMLRNGIMAPRIFGLTELAGRLESQDGLSFFDLEQGVYILNDGVDDRLLMGYQPGGF